MRFGPQIGNARNTVVYFAVLFNFVLVRGVRGRSFDLGAVYLAHRKCCCGTEFPPLRNAATCVYITAGGAIRRSSSDTFGASQVRLPPNAPW